MQTAQRFKVLLDKYIAGTCNPQEKALMEHWFEKGGNINKADLELDELQRRQLLNKFHSMQGKQFSSPINKPLHKISLLITGRYAAAIWIGLLFTASISTWKLGIISKLFNDREYVVTYQLVQTGRGEIKQIRLPDSSVVMLNANSTLAYHPDFAKHRQIRLSGEALFSVTRDKNHPFSVMTSDSIATTVLGTRFNIQSYDKGDDIRITVVSGVVAVARATQSPDTLRKLQAFHYHKASRSFILSQESNTESVTGWTKGEWNYENLRFSDLAILLHNHYGITLTSKRNTALLQTGVNVNFNNKQSAKDILEIFCAFAGCSFRQINTTAIEIH